MAAVDLGVDLGYPFVELFEVAGADRYRFFLYLFVLGYRRVQYALGKLGAFFGVVRLDC